MRTSFGILNWVHSFPPPAICVCPLSESRVLLNFVPGCYMRVVEVSIMSVCAGQLVFRRHRGPCIPSHHAIRATCMQLLPFVEMHYKWELEEDCSNLRAHMLRFDFEAHLERHELGRSLLLMIQDDEAGLEIPAMAVGSAATTSTFDAIRARLAAVDDVFQCLQAQVLLAKYFDSTCSIPEVLSMVLDTAICQLSQSRMQTPYRYKVLSGVILCSFHVPFN